MSSVHLHVHDKIPKARKPATLRPDLVAFPDNFAPETTVPIILPYRSVGLVGLADTACPQRNELLSFVGLNHLLDLFLHRVQIEGSCRLHRRKFDSGLR